MKTSPAVVTSEQMEMHRLGLPVAVSEKVYEVISGKSRKRIQNERLRGVGIKFLKDGKSVRYLLGDILAEVEKNKVA